MSLDKKDEAINQLSQALEEATKKLEEQDAALKDMSAMPGVLARITNIIPPLDKDPERIIIDERLMLDYPQNIKLKRRLKVGDWVHVTKGMMGTVGIVGIVELPIQPRVALKVAEVLPDGRMFFDMGGNLVLIRESKVKAEVGDRVMLAGDSPLDTIAIENLGKDTKSFQFNDDIGVTWNDIGGQTNAKAMMREAIEYPILHAALYQKLGKKPIKGVLLEGPPGCGKTLLAKAAASSIAKLHGKNASASGYIYVKGPEILSKWVGEAEATIRSLFLMAREHKRKHGYPAVLFIDECEAILSKRGMGVSSDMEKTIVPSFLAEMDGLHDSAAMVILATNRGDRLDPAVIRDGRIDRRIAVTRPNEADAADIFSIHLKNVPSAQSRARTLSKGAATKLFDVAYELFHVDVGAVDPLVYTLANCASGAMIAGIVDRATSIVLNEAVNKGTSRIADLEESHIFDAINQTYTQMKRIDHTEDLVLLAESHGAKIKGVARVV